MARNKGDVRKIAELSYAFMALNDRGKDSALTILRTLSYAQAAMGADTHTGDKKHCASAV